MSATVGKLLHDVQLLERLAHFNCEKVPERQPHAKSAGSFGVLEVTGELSTYRGYGDGEMTAETRVNGPETAKMETIGFNSFYFSLY